MRLYKLENIVVLNMVLFRGEPTDKFANKYKIDSSRLKNWDYTSSGIYFITICTYRHNNFFGKIAEGKMELSSRGKIAFDCMTEIPKHVNVVRMGEFVVMPNHVHMLLEISQLLSNSVETDDNNVETHDNNVETHDNNVETHDNNVETHDNNVETHDHASLQKGYTNFYFHRMAIKSCQTIPLVIKQFKSSVKRICNKQNLFFAWQSRYYDHIVKSEIGLNMIREYIKSNPKNWEKDKLYMW